MLLKGMCREEMERRKEYCFCVSDTNHYIRELEFTDNKVQKVGFNAGKIH